MIARQSADKPRTHAEEERHESDKPPTLFHTADNLSIIAQQQRKCNTFFKYFFHLSKPSTKTVQNILIILSFCGRIILIISIRLYFCPDREENNTVKKEEIVTLTLPYSPKRQKTVRVYIPAHEEGETFPVIYMTDGQNLFEEETTRFGSWLTHDAVKAEQAQSGKAAIIVGIHNDGSPLERNNDLTPKSIGKINGFLMKILAFPSPDGESFARFVTEVVKPAVEKKFPVKTDRDNTAFCGSSSGGLMSFYMALTYPGIFSAAGVFSPAMILYSEKDMSGWIRSRVSQANGLTNGQNMPFLYIYTGNGDKREKDMFKGEQQTYAVLKECYPNDLLKEVVIPDAMHNEGAWAPVFRDFLHFFLTR